MVSNQRSFYFRRGKRFCDLVLCVPLLIVLMPILILLACVVQFKLGSPILFRHQRPGWHARPFTLIKFRTMSNGIGDNGSSLPDTMRITRFGQLLRVTSLDELPELFNVLKGEMSIVGPRPLLMQYLDRYTPEQMRRHNVRPGITGWAQVQGRNALPWEKKFALDVWYVDHVSFWLDLKILALTFWKILKREGISQPGYVSSEEFRGSNKIV